MPNIIDLLGNPQKKYSSEEILKSIAESRGDLSDNLLSSLSHILELRAAAQDSVGCRLCVFSMPKSGSSFVQTSLKKSLKIPLMSLTSLSFNSSALGANPREQELDELAIIFSNIVSKSYVAQHHTRASKYLCTLLRNYVIAPIVCFRNIPDCLVSNLDMCEQSLDVTSDVLPLNIWFNYGGRIPNSWNQMSRSEKMDCTINSFAKWYIEFFISWKRAALCKQASPLFVWYELDILNGSNGLVEKMENWLKLNQGQKDLLSAYISNPDKTLSRFNKGISGRGVEELTVEQYSRILQIAKPFAGELTENECRLLFSAGIDDIRAS